MGIMKRIHTERMLAGQGNVPVLMPQYLRVWCGYDKPAPPKLEKPKRKKKEAVCR